MMHGQKIIILLHIGQGKTGSTAIQRFLDFNRETLASKHKVLYPNFDSNDLTKGSMPCHTVYLNDARNRNDFAGLLTILEKSVDYCRNNKLDKILLSDESLPNWEGWPQIFSQIAGKLDLEVNVIVYLRRQDKWLESAWKQWGHKFKQINTIHDYEQIMNLDWSRMLKPWLDFFEVKQFTVRPYEKSTIGNDVVADFLKAIGINNAVDLPEPPNFKYYNTGYNRDIIELLSLCKNLTFNHNDNRLFGLLSKTLPTEYIKKPMEDYGLLSPEEALNLIKKYEASNNKVAQIFFGMDRAKLFNDPLPNVDAHWEPYPGLTLEKFVPVVMSILLKQQQEIDSLKNLKDNLIQKQKIDYDKLRPILKVTNKSIFKKSKFLNQITDITLNGEGVTFTSEGNDPYLILPKLRLPKKVKVIKLDISVPENTELQLFYKTSASGAYCEENSVKKTSREGKNQIHLEIPAWEIVGLLRLDPGAVAGQYIIHNIEFLG